MSPGPESLRRLVKASAHLDADGMHFVYALACAMNEHRGDDEFLAVMETNDPSLVKDWLRSHGWLAEGCDLGPRGMAAMLQINQPGYQLN